MMFVMPRDRVVVTKLGRAYEFRKDEPLHVPQMAWAIVQEQGAVPVEELPTPGTTFPAVPQGAARTKLIKEAIAQIVLRGSREDFGAGGAPHTAVISQVLGFSIDSRERDKAWASAKTDEE